MMSKLLAPPGIIGARECVFVQDGILPVADQKNNPCLARKPFSYDKKFSHSGFLYWYYTKGSAPI